MRSFVFHKPCPVASMDEVIEIPKDWVRKPQSSYKARAAAIETLQKMAGAAKKDGIEIVVISAYRTLEEQRNLFLDGERRHGKGRAILWLAPPGYSEHHTGYVFDLADKSNPQTDDEPAFESTAASRWLNMNAAAYGFELSFPKGNWQGVSYEPWHWRYVGNRESLNIFHPNPIRALISFFQTIIMGVYFRCFGI